MMLACLLARPRISPQRSKGGAGSCILEEGKEGRKGLMILWVVLNFPTVDAMDLIHEYVVTEWASHGMAWHNAEGHQGYQGAMPCP